jgi:putative DNA primase/helicase
MLLTNEFPKLSDASGALASRMLLLRLIRSFYGQEDQGLTDRLLAERPGILRWAIAGLQRLTQRGHFDQPPSGRELLSQLEDLASPVSAFVSECCVLGADKQVPKLTLYNRWRAWCDAEGRDRPGTAASFGRDLLATYPTVRSSHPRIDDKQVYAYAGIALAG